VLILRRDAEGKQNQSKDYRLHAKVVSDSNFTRTMSISLTYDLATGA
jgi:hypothetical protein